MKYLAVKNWEIFQPKMRTKSPKRQWIMDYTDKEFDADYMKLSCLQRYVLDALCRLRGRLGHDIPYDDPTWVIRLLHVSRTDAPHIPHAVRTLCARNFLIEYIQQDTSRYREGEGDIEEENIYTNRLTAVVSNPSEAVAVSSKSMSVSVGDEQ